MESQSRHSTIVKLISLSLPNFHEKVMKQTTVLYHVTMEFRDLGHLYYCYQNFCHCQFSMKKSQKRHKSCISYCGVLRFGSSLLLLMNSLSLPVFHGKNTRNRQQSCITLLWRFESLGFSIVNKFSVTASFPW